jgi:hypothetical protein
MIKLREGRESEVGGQKSMASQRRTGFTTRKHSNGHDREYEGHEHEYPLEWVELVRIGLVAVAVVAGVT